MREVFVACFSGVGLGLLLCWMDVPVWEARALAAGAAVVTVIYLGMTTDES